MKNTIEHEKYDTKLEASDWRFSAAIVGMIKYFIYHDIGYEIKNDYILYNSADITEEKYLEFVEYKYSDELYHKIVENKLSNSEFEEKDIKEINEKLSGNSIMKKTFGKKKFNGENKDEILNIIDENRLDITKETYRNKTNLYKNYCNPNQLFSEKNEYCRLLGYTLDASKKSKSTGYLFNKKSFVGEDIIEFDFIPFAFSGTSESFFINDNITIKRLKQSNDEFVRKIDSQLNDGKFKNTREALFKGIIESADFINYDVEIIYKDMNKDYFETLYLRKESINIFKKIKDINKNSKENIDEYYKVFTKFYKLKNDEYINIQKNVTDNILNNILMDEYIELFLREKNKDYLISQLILLNILIRGDETMKKRLKGAYACAKKVAEVIPQNKIDTYRQKLTSSVIFKDYDRVCQILLQLSNYSNVEFGFIYDLFENFEENKDLAYTFINALSKNKIEKDI